MCVDFVTQVIRKRAVSFVGPQSLTIIETRFQKLQVGYNLISVFGEVELSYSEMDYVIQMSELRLY